MIRQICIISGRTSERKQDSNKINKQKNIESKLVTADADLQTIVCMSCHISEAAQTCCSEQAKSLKLEINVCWQIKEFVGSNQIPVNTGNCVNLNNFVKMIPWNVLLFHGFSDHWLYSLTFPRFQEVNLLLGTLKKDLERDGGEGIKKRSEVFIYWGSLRWHYKPLQPLSLLLLLQNNYPVTTALPNFSKQTHRYIYNKWYSNLTKDEVLKLWHALKLLFWSHVH